MKIKILTIVSLLVLITSAVWATAISAAEEENAILAQALKQPFTGGGYTIVNPMTNLPINESALREKRYIAEQLQSNYPVVLNLLDQLIARNGRSAWLSLKSSEKDGYLIDYTGEYKKYLQGDGAGWDRLYHDHPKAHGYTTVSLPVHDQKTGLVLLYKATQSHAQTGTGWIILYKYDSGRLRKLKAAIVWVS